MRAARLRFLGVVLGVTVVLLSGSAASGGVCERVVEGVECALGRDGQLEAVADPGVLDLDGEGVLAGVPEQKDVESVALSGGEFAGGIGGAGHLVPPCSLTSPRLGGRGPQVAVTKSDSRCDPATIWTATYRRSRLLLR